MKAKQNEDVDMNGSSCLFSAACHKAAFDLCVLGKEG